MVSRSVPPSGSRHVTPEHELVVEERAEVAACVHPGLTRDRNEDAAALGTGSTPSGEPFYALVVCDGIGSSLHAELASAVAATTARDSLVKFGRSTDGQGAEAAMAQALRDAHEAVCAQGFDATAGVPPGTTCVAAFVVRKRVVVGWAGDSRAYWLTERGAEQLTRDHSCANDAVARGEATLEKAMRAPDAHDLTRALGLAESGKRTRLEVDVVSRDLATPGRLLLCTDGLWNYYPLPEQMDVLTAARRRAKTAGQFVRFLVHRALVRGGQDNVSVAVHTHR